MGMSLDTTRSRQTNLEGLKVLITAIDLEQSEHRGIAVFTKGLLKALRQAGAEVWLLTQFHPSMADVESRRLPTSTSQLIFSARVLDSLDIGQLTQGFKEQQSPLSRLPFRPTWRKQLGRIKRLITVLFPRRHFDLGRLKALPLHGIYDNPYLQSERLAYLQNVDGIICANDLFVHSFRLAQQRHGFDGLVCTCPINLETSHGRFLVQTIHDLIPLEYVPTSDDAVTFSRRLKACASSARLYVSDSTRYKYESVILQDFKTPDRHASCVAIQSPSLTFPADACDWEARIPELSLNAEGQKRNQLLKPCRYFLFNSSVEPRKNLLFVLKAFVESGVERGGVKLCITGKLKADSYSMQVKNLVQNHPDIILMGYVDEATKRQLFLNALAVVSPSLVEGFGIPVLDAACLGIPVIASPSESHREILNLHDFEQHVLLCSTLETSDWASAMRLTVIKMERNRQEACGGDSGQLQPQREKLWLDELRQQRIHRYWHLQRSIDAAFQASITRVIQEELTLRYSVGHPDRHQAAASAPISSRI
jgi:glycosyltransferase involved in cell wall biosynthesis